jgi:hypothetical protein
MRYHFWYVILHVALGLAAYDRLTFTNIGGLYAAGAAAIIQAYAIWEIHRDAYPKFQAALAKTEGTKARQEMIKGYRVRLLKHWAFRTSAYGLLTLFSAMFVRGAMQAVGRWVS